jgi:hypothetical protein
MARLRGNVAAFAALAREVGKAQSPEAVSHSGKAVDYRSGSFAGRVLVTRTDTGSRNWRLTASRRELRRHGAVNSTHDAKFVGAQAPLSYVSTTERDTMTADVSKPGKAHDAGLSAAAVKAWRTEHGRHILPKGFPG